MDTRRPVGTVLVFQSIWNFGGYILNECPAEGDVEKLRPAADRKQGKLHVPGGLNEGDLGFVTCKVGCAAMRRTGLSIKRRFYIFAARKEETVNAVENCSDGILTREGWYDDWYDACTFECGDVGIVEPHSMRPILEIRSCRYSDHST